MSKNAGHFSPDEDPTISVSGGAASGSPPSGNPLLVAGWDTTNVRTILTDTSGRQVVVGPVGNGVAVSGSPVRVGGSDGTTTRDILTDSSGRLVNVGRQTPADAVSAPTDAMDTRAFGMAYNNSTWDRLRNSSAANISRTTQPDALVVTQQGQWPVVAQPAAATVATVSKAAGGAGVRHVCTGFIVSYWGNANASNAGNDFQLRDGASGAGTVLVATTLSLPASATVNVIDRVVSPPLNLFGSANTAMTLEFSGAGPASTHQRISGQGWST